MNYTSVAQNPYSPFEEQLNAISHGIGTILALIGLVFLVQKSSGIHSQLVCAVYGLSMVLMFLSSTLYHQCRNPELKAKLKILDHCAIYLLIAGTYTPLMVIAIGGWIGISGMVIVWSIALIGIYFKIFANQRFPKLSVLTYLTMGWIAVFYIYPLSNALSEQGLWWLVAGGLCYTIGVLFYIAKKIPFTHAIWHLFVVAGSGCHFFVIYNHVI